MLNLSKFFSNTIICSSFKLIDMLLFHLLIYTDTDTHGHTHTHTLAHAHTHTQTGMRICALSAGNGKILVQFYNAEDVYEIS